jgi:transglutaminase-like putative cysteine protease
MTQRSENGYLLPGEFIESRNQRIVQAGNELTAGANDDREGTRRLFYFVRDRISFRPVFFNRLARKDFLASRTLERGYGFCILKALLLISLLRSVGVPARLVLADIRHHQMPQEIMEALGSDVIPHGYGEAFLGERWVALNPSYDTTYCETMGYVPTEFDGKTDALFHSVDRNGSPLIDYLRVIGSYADLPYEFLMDYIGRRYGTLDPSIFERINKGTTYYAWS